MKIALLWAGKTRNPHLHLLIEDYVQRLRHFCELSLREVPSVKNQDPARLLSLEGERLLSQVNATDFLVLLDSAGQRRTTREFTAFLARHRDTSSKALVFVVGGPEGVSPAVRARADSVLSLSPMTFPHEIARCLVIEQVYRAFSILNGSPYHK